MQPNPSIVNVRSGLATIEIAFCLLVLSVITTAMFMVFSYSYSASGMAAAARYHAWSARHTPWDPTPESQLVILDRVADHEYPRILGNAPRLDPDSVLYSEARKEARIFEFSSEIVTDHYVMGGVWDHQEIEFRRHPRLVPMEQFNIFVASSISWSRIQSLASFADPGLAAMAQSTRNDYLPQEHHSNEALDRLRGRLNAQVAERESERSSLLSRIAQAQAQDPPDEGLIRSLKNALNEVNRQLAELRRALASLGAARRAQP